MKRLALLVAVLALAAGGAYAQDACVTTLSDGGYALTLAVYGDGCEKIEFAEDHYFAELCFYGGGEEVCYDSNGGMDFVDGNMVVEISDFEIDSDVWWIWGYGDADLSAEGYWSENPLDIIDDGGTCDGCDPPGGGEEPPPSEEGEEEPAPTGAGMRIIGGDGIDYAGRAVDGEDILLSWFDGDGVEIGLEQVGVCYDVGCLDSDCGWGVSWDAEGEPEGEPEGEGNPAYVLTLADDRSDDLIIGRVLINLDQGAGMMSIIGTPEDGNAEVADCLEIPWALDPPVATGTPVAGMLGLGLVAAACALGGAVTLRKK